jgi:uncharacterized damage-inducible protein DinB
MEISTLLEDAFTRVNEVVHGALEDLTADDLTWRADADANTVAWLVWHLTRVQDDHVAGVAGVEQAWTAQGWEKRFDLPFAAGATGYAHTSEQVAEVRVAGPEVLAEYHDAVHRLTLDFLGGLEPGELDRVVDTRWDPPVTLGVRLVSVLSDTLQHAGQASLLRGVILRTRH